ncbi:hypothetical protein F3Y22_tig00003041pilonHSYRG00292 [Hibiscus syriacus]|uniref:Uncharacterized protein n=2 Tax=Hibiscus syriacus TaxID=106335 RepID=A0A6A3CS03_HIBSY|nr:hypothetical protein F3Y22_tig00003041pilonHSYRG00292 [Hibiscus syriacus]
MDIDEEAMKMSLKRLSILRKLLSKSNNVLRIPILLTKMKKPMMIHKLVFLKKSTKLNRFKLLNHYNYGFLGEYQLDSSSTTPLIHYYNPQHELQNRSSHNIYSLLFRCNCFGSLNAQARQETDCRLALDVDHLPAAMALPCAVEIDFEDDSVDERAERFIENFYAEMRLQRQESF